MRPEAGQRFAHFHTYSILGRGGMGVVFSAYNVRAQRVVALKLLPAGQALHPAARARFEREARLAQQLSSPYAVPVLDAGEYDGELWLEMPLLPGEDLEARLQRVRLSPEEALHVTGQVAQALDAAHRLGLVHRDVKPANIRLMAGMSADQPRACLGDFGLTRPAVEPEASLTAVDEVVGTAPYMSPEQISRRPVDGRTDVYALACVVYRCLAGAPPFHGNREEVFTAHCTQPPPLLRPRAPGVGPRLEQAVLRCLAKDPAARPSTAGQFAAECLRALSEDRSGRWAAPPPPPPPFPPARPRRCWPFR